MTAAAQLSGVGVSYRSVDGPVVALRGVDLVCEAATSTSIVGRSGSGKSTLISVLSLLRRPTEGSVCIEGVAVSDMRERERAALRAGRIGIVFQAFHLEPSLTVVDNVMLGWHFAPHGLSRAAARERACSDLEELGIGDLAARRPHALSGGQRQRVAIARAVFTRPALLVADEPTGNLDEETAGDVAALLLALPRAHGTALVMVTHDTTIAALAQHRMRLDRGVLARVAP
ncbi:ATP-binding cassette domain-containing protein [Nocardioides zeae]|uniref:ABC transporter ATP-binding protein n=1 Tax=Nocardioides zeae TaxID=1457234 RepID=A0A6P0HDM9_9ACTN|nr:ABC transporter ATP-binding protein [Nocardioides zeae]